MRAVPRVRALVPALGAALACVALGCGGDGPTGGSVPAGATLALAVSNLPALDAAREGAYVAWVQDRSGGWHSLGSVDPRGSTTLTTPVADPAAFTISVERSGTAPAAPSPQRLLTGPLRGSRAVLEIAGAVTLGDAPLRDRPGQFTMFSPSDNSVHGYPSFEESGVWLFNMAPRETPQGDMWVRLAPLQPGWVYEGWMVRDIDTPGAIWLSYGKFTPDPTGAINTRDDTGWGAYSGAKDFLTAGEEEFPGDDWIANPLAYPLPAGLTLPLDLREKTGSGASRWTHVISIEPASDRGEAIGSQRPFPVRPYRDAFGDGGPGIPRTITFRPDAVPRGEVVRK
jgi:hypothetical protein